MTVGAPVAPEAKAQAEQIRAAAESNYNRLRGRGDLSAAGIQSGIAKVYLSARDQMAALQTKTSGDADARRRALTAAVFGIDDIAGSNPVDRAAAAMSLRDAQDRAARIERGDEALALLRRAETSGDELLARALAQHAWTQGLSSLGNSEEWDDVINEFAATRPVAEKALPELLDMNRGGALADLWAFILTAPPELVGVDDWQLADLAGKQPGQAGA